MKVAICIPVHGDTNPRFTRALARLMQLTSPVLGAENLQLEMATGSILPALRNGLAEQAKKWGADYILWMDSDHTFPTTSLLRLLSHGKEIVGCNYPKRLPPHHPTSVKNGAPVYTNKDSSGLEQVDSIGLGLCLMKMSVFDALSQPYFAFGEIPGSFNFIGEDVSFFSKARLPVFVDHELSWAIEHVGERLLTNADTGPAA